MKKLAYLVAFFALVAELHANPVAPKSIFGFNTGWTIIAGVILEYAIAFQLLKRHLAVPREFFVRFLGVHIATLPICFIASAIEDYTAWILAQAVVIFIESWFYTKAPGHPKWKIAFVAAFVANVSSAAFAIATHRF